MEKADAVPNFICSHYCPLSFVEFNCIIEIKIQTLHSKIQNCTLAKILLMVPY